MTTSILDRLEEKFNICTFDCGHNWCYMVADAFRLARKEIDKELEEAWQRTGIRQKILYEKLIGEKEDGKK